MSGQLSDTFRLLECSQDRFLRFVGERTPIMKRADFPFLGHGIGLRREHYGHVLEQHPRIDWLEVISENFMVAGGRPLHVLEKVREHYPIVLHGVSMNLGSSDPLSNQYLAELRNLARRFEPAWVSDHLCWTGVDRLNLHDLLPLPYTEETVRWVARRIRRVQEFLERSILIENVSSYLSFQHSTMTEWEFLSAVSEEADCGILLDLNNIFVSAFNHGFDPKFYLRSVPVERVVQYHLAGHRNFGTYLLDTHDQLVAPEVWSLYGLAAQCFGRTSTLIEWDDQIPEFSVLQGIAEKSRTLYCYEEQQLLDMRGSSGTETR
jgi:uncharacterized protein